MTAVLALTPPSAGATPQPAADTTFAPLRIERLSSWTAAPPALPSASWICWVDAPGKGDAA